MLDVDCVDVATADAEAMYGRGRRCSEVEHLGCYVHRQRRHVVVHLKQTFVRAKTNHVGNQLQHVVLGGNQQSRLVPRLFSLVNKTK